MYNKDDVKNFLSSLSTDYENLSTEQRIYVLELYTKLKFNEGPRDPSEFYRYLSMGWYVYNMIDNSHTESDISDTHDSVSVLMTDTTDDTL